MNATLRHSLPLFVLLLAAAAVHGQGVFVGSNVSQRTRVGSVDGPLASTNIFGQFLAGPTADSLSPVGFTHFHYTGGVFAPGTTTVPNVSGNAYGFVQLAAWDGAVWGTSLAGVPSEQLGRTDIVAVLLSDGFSPMYPPVFTQPALVPVPEPSSWALGLLGALALLPLLRRRP